MTMLYVLIPLSVCLLGVIIWAFFWAIKNEQFDDLETPAISILTDDKLESAGKKDPSTSCPRDELNTIDIKP